MPIFKMVIVSCNKTFFFSYTEELILPLNETVLIYLQRKASIFFGEIFKCMTLKQLDPVTLQKYALHQVRVIYWFMNYDTSNYKAIRVALGKSNLHLWNTMPQIIKHFENVDA